MTLTEIRRLMDSLGARPKRRFGQNFMYDQNLVRRIVEIIGVTSKDELVEIGPGLGSLTDVLYENSKKLTLIEQDTTFIEHLRSRYPEARIVHGDALELIEEFKHKISNHLVVGNLPYSVASPLMITLCEPPYRPRKMVFTIQLEVAERLVAAPDTKDYGLLTLLTQAFYDIEIARKVPPSVFWPAPEVESAVVVMTRKQDQPFTRIEDDISFREIGKKAFQKRRKTLGAIFAADLPSFMDRSKRAENISVEEWVAFAKENGKKTEEIFDVVDSNDQVIEQRPRTEVHRTKKLHRAVHIFVWNKRGELLLQKRSPWKDVAPNTWDSSAAGHLGAGEEYDSAADREIEEELGVRTKLKPLKKLKACEELGWEFVWVYEGISEGPFQFPESEISEIKWWKPADIDKAIADNPAEFAGSFRYIWKDFSTTRSLHHA